MLATVKARAGLIALAIVAALLVAGIVVIRWQSGKIDDQAERIATLQLDLKAESQARQRDVAALTLLTRNLIEAHKASAIDREVLSDAIKSHPVQPASPALDALLDGLREADARRAGTAAGAGGAPPR